MNDSEVRFTLDQVQRYETCKALLEGRLTTQEAAQALACRASLHGIFL